MIPSVILLSLLTGTALVEAGPYVPIPVVCPCTFVANRVVNGAVKLAKHILKKEDGCECSLPARQSKECDEDYIQRVFVQKEDEPIEDYYKRIYIQYKDESDEKYVERIDKIYSVLPTLPCKDNIDDWNYSHIYYTLKYGRLSTILPFIKESDDQYYARILRREKNEDFDSYIKRLDCIFKAYPKLDIWRRIKFDSDCRNWYFYRHVAYNSAIRPSENIRESIVTQYERRDCEQDDDLSYFKRITTRLQGESDDEYVDRLTKIRSKYSKLPLWNSCEYLDLIKKYYELLYAKKEDENCNDYYKRITTKSTTEDLSSYVKRLNCLQRVFPTLEIWFNEDFLPYLVPYYNFIFAKKPNEDNKSYLKRITCRNPSETKENFLKRLNICRWVNRDSDLFYSKVYWKYIEPYYKDFFRKGKEEVDTWLSRIFKRGYEETDDEYCKRMSLVTSVQESLGKIDIPERCLKFISDFYRCLYKKRPDEDKDSWLKRVTDRLPIETDITYQTRLKYLENIYTDCRSFVGGVLSRLFGSSGGPCKEDKELEVLLVKKKETGKKKEVAKTNKKKVEKTVKKSDKKSIEDEIEEAYGKKKDEDETSWFKRLTKKSPGDSLEQYVKTLNLIRKYFPSLTLWYNNKYFDLVKEYYSCLYKKLDDESDEKYFERIVSKESWESWRQAAERVSLVQHLYPSLPLWADEKYFDKCTKNLYEAQYKRLSTESDEEYVKRLFAKDSSVDTSTELWAKRVHLIQLATASSSIWYSEKCYPTTKSFFEVFYKKEETEACDAWLTRVLKPLTGESGDNAIKRVQLVKKTTGDCGCWTEFTFKKVQSSKCLSQEYLDGIEKKFFDSATTYEKRYSSSKSSSSSESSSSEKEVEVVKKS